MLVSGQMSARVYCGTSGYSYPPWKPDFYPAKLPSKKFLAHYASRLNAVESNYTFRSLPSEKTIANWIGETPEDFVFAIKGNQNITHSKKVPLADICPAFFGALASLQTAGRLGPVLFQFPPFAKADPDRLLALLGLCPAGVRIAFEFRNTSWFTDPIYRILEDHGAALCLAESQKLETPKVMTANFGYFRLRKGEYTAEALAGIAADALKLRKEGKDSFLFFMHEDDPTGPAFAEEVLRSTR
jgi:uncharacterized protein YecE (DUF72 family)